jgi:hypothetical protein
LWASVAFARCLIDVCELLHVQAWFRVYAIDLALYSGGSYIQDKRAKCGRDLKTATSRQVRPKPAAHDRCTDTPRRFPAP